MAGFFRNQGNIQSLGPVGRQAGFKAVSAGLYNRSGIMDLKAGSRVTDLYISINTITRQLYHSPQKPGD